MEQNIDTRQDRFRRRTRRHHEKPWGLILLLIGVLLFLKTANILTFPVWMFTWPVLLIVLGLFFGARHGFRGGVWIGLVIFGAFSLADSIDPTLQMERYMWPVILIAVGLLFIIRPRKNRWRRWKHARRFDNEGSEQAGMMVFDESASSDYLDVTSVFGGIKKNMISKNFKGGEITCTMGGAEIDLSQADFKGTIHLDVSMVFGGAKLVVPASWDVQSEISAVFGGVDDKRQISGVNLDPEKVLILDGSCVFGGIEIRSY